MTGGMYRIENTASDHAGVLKYTMLSWGEKQPDIFLVSKEGVKVYTQRLGEVWLPEIVYDDRISGFFFVSTAV